MYTETKEEIQKRFDLLIEKIKMYEINETNPNTEIEILQCIKRLKELAYKSGYHDGW